MASLTTIATVASLAGTAISAAGTIAAGKAQQAAANYEAAQLEVRAREEKAAAHQEAQRLKRQKELALSTLQAYAAKSGFMPTDETTQDIAGEIEEYGTLQEQMAQYGGTSRYNAMRAAAQGRRMSGAAAAKGAKYGAAGTILGGIGSMAGKFATPTQSNVYRYG